MRETLAEDYIRAKTWEYPWESYVFPELVENIISVEKCPNCDRETYISWKCSSCGLLIWWKLHEIKPNNNHEIKSNNNNEDYFARKEKLSKSLKWSWKYIKMNLSNGREFVYVDYNNRLDREKQEIKARIKYNWNTFEIFANYSVKEIQNYIDWETNKDLIVNILKHPDIKDKDTKCNILSIFKSKRKKLKKTKWFLDYKIAKEIIKKILEERFKIYN